VPTAANATLLLLHEPPPDELLRVVVAPVHTVAVPVLAGGAAFTVNAIVAVQPAGKV